MGIKVRGTVLKALRVLESFGEHPDATGAEIAERVGITRITAYGLLETLVEAGYLYRDGPRDRYRITNRPMILSRGLNSLALVATVAAPAMLELTQKYRWPFELMVLSGTEMVVVETSDRHSPYSIARLKRRQSFPLYGCAAGYAYLAFCAEGDRRDLITRLIASSPSRTGAQKEYAYYETYLPKIRNIGFSRIDFRPFEEKSLAAPIFVQGTLTAAIQMRYIENAPVDWAAMGQLIVQEAKAIGARVEQLQAGLDIWAGDAGQRGQKTKEKAVERAGPIF